MSLSSLTIKKEDLFIDKETGFIGKGCFGSVYKGALSGVSVAVKIPIDELTPTELKTYLHEMELMNNFHSSNVVLFIGVVTPTTTPMFVHEFIKTDLSKYIHCDNITSEYLRRPLDVPLKIDLFLQCCERIQWLHNVVNIIHRDVKPANFLLDENFHIKVGDFGFADTLQSKSRTFRDFSKYCAPEVLLMAKSIGKEIDVYSLGITMWEVFYESAPFFEYQEIKTTAKMIELLKSGGRPILPVTFIEENEHKKDKENEVHRVRKTFKELIEKTPKDAELIMKRCWEFDAKKRVGIDKLVELVNTLRLGVSLGDSNATSWWQKNFEGEICRTNFVLVDEFIKPIVKTFRLKEDDEKVLKRNIGVANEIDIMRFKYLIRLFGKFYNDKNCLRKMVDVFKAEWWFGGITKDDAVATLEGHVDGTFLVRESYNVVNAPITISKRSEGRTTHTRIYTKGKKDGGVEYTITARGKESKYDDLTFLIEAKTALSFITFVCDRKAAPSIY
ncbi:cell division protein kinase, putative [Entamoeba invadens IP1]|uniref:Cell division protein kinase, putative n=1 Tax=Entamoeba invadens IP1 TaxID=370355 RepID=L7FLL9_ENTIV|nr:cell division protein kinase, putative [Entamoeba invadens IP1]ELP88713.1 cell division protein kinase, putative [Entamoeba invadens IP1]|eukprot:XP_004255484.1 cell division protein kinase, putative [Entamoeba invadens IP1]